jgi:exosortase D (VPLPA-CTERM-specific)
MVGDWYHDPNYSHGFLIPLVSGYLLWEKRKILNHLFLNPSNLGIVVILGGIVLRFIGQLGAELFLMRFSLLVILTGLVIFLFGKGYLKAISFPLAYLIFMIPLPFLVFNAIAFPLQLVASRIAAQFLDLLAIPALREGNIIQLPYFTMEVAEACSGIRSLISLLALATAFAYFSEKGWLKRSIIIVSAIPIAILVNAMRVSTTGILVYWISPEAAQGFFHIFSGWLMFLLAFGLLFAESSLLSRYFPEHSARKNKPQMVNNTLQFREYNYYLSPTRLIIVTAILFFSFFYLQLVSQGEAVPLRKDLQQLPLQIGPWQGRDQKFSPKIMEKLGVEDSIMRYYRHPSGQYLWLYIGYHASQRQGDLIHSPKHCYPGSGWYSLEAGQQSISLTHAGNDGQVITVNRYLIQKGLEQQLVLYWYQERGRVVANEYWGKLYLVWDAFTRRRTDGALVRVSAPVDGVVEHTLNQEIDFIKLLFPLLKEYLPD